MTVELTALAVSAAALLVAVFQWLFTNLAANRRGFQLECRSGGDNPVELVLVNWGPGLAYQLKIDVSLRRRGVVMHRSGLRIAQPMSHSTVIQVPVPQSSWTGLPMSYVEMSQHFDSIEVVIGYRLSTLLPIRLKREVSRPLIDVCLPGLVVPAP